MNALARLDQGPPRSRIDQYAIGNTIPNRPPLKLKPVTKIVEFADRMCNARTDDTLFNISTNKALTHDAVTTTDSLEDLFPDPFDGRDLPLDDAGPLREALASIMGLAESYEPLPPYHLLLQDPKRPRELAAVPACLQLERPEPRLALQRGKGDDVAASPSVRTSAYITARRKTTGPPVAPSFVDILLDAVRMKDGNFDVHPPGRPPVRPAGMPVDVYAREFSRAGVLLPVTVDNTPSLTRPVQHS